MTNLPPAPTPSELKEIMSALMLGAAFQGDGGPTLQTIADAHPKIVAGLSKLDPVQAAAAFGSLLTIPELQGNCLRIETLVHLAMMAAKGTSKPTPTFLKSAFQAMGDGFCGHMEDPAEDVFVSAVRTPRGNFRVLEGIWEGNGFFLQRFLNVIEAMPRGNGYDSLRDNIYSLLALSDLVCERAHLDRHQLGTELPAKRLITNVLGDVNSKVGRIRFSLAELRQIDIEPLLLAPFLFNPPDRSQLPNEQLGNSSFERRPLIREPDHVSVALPTAISAAIRYYVIEQMETAGMRGALGTGIAREYAEHFSNTWLLGSKRRAPVDFQYTNHGALAGVVSAIDKGRYLNVIFFTDNLADFDETGLAGMNPDGPAMDKKVGKFVDQAYQMASKQADFVDGISLVVSCGVGRGSALILDREDRPNWTVEFASAYDLDTLCWTPRFKLLSLWRLLAASKHAEELGADLQNINGLLNLVAWARSLDGHVVPHGDLPDDFAEDGRSAMLMITQNSLRDLRHEVAVHHDIRVVQDLDGRWIPVRRDRQSDFADDDAAPLYGSEIANHEGWLMSVYLATERAWWAEASMPEDTPGHIAYERWRLMTVWLTRVAPVLDELSGLPTGPVKWRAVFEAATSGLRSQTPQHDYDEVRAAITVTFDRATATVTTTASPVFEDAIFHVENIAERALVDALLEGVLAFADISQVKRCNLLRAIVTSPQARHAHGFAARNFRDFVYGSLERKIIKIDRDDDAAIRLGLGWSIRNRAVGGRLSGKADTTAFLNALVTKLQDDLCGDLQAFNQTALLKRLLINYESAAFDEDRWTRTSAAVLALHPDIEATLATINEHKMELNGVFQASRILMEIAICESPYEGGREPGELDLARLMAKAALIFHLGGWSDAIRWDVMEPTIRITPLGDVHAKFDFVDEVIEPNVREISNARTKDAADNYAENLKQVEGTPTVSGRADPKFLEAWEDEFGTTFQHMRVFIDWLENTGIQRGEAVMCLSPTDFSKVTAEGQILSPEVIAGLLDKLTLASRPSWRIVPDGFDERDRQPWRYRRRLSIVRRPILKIGPAHAVKYLIAPGMIRQSFGYLVANYMQGDFPPHQLSKKMKAWGGRQADARGAKFTKDVERILQNLGWRTETEVKITKILGRRLDRDYGDVDVLAWRPNEPRVLVIECKDVQFKKTFGEICEQLADFRGELRPNGKPDYLRRHLDRMDVLTANTSEVAAYLKSANVHPIFESHLIFKNPVPMKHALSKLSEQVVVSIFDDLIKLT